MLDGGCQHLATGPALPEWPEKVTGQVIEQGTIRVTRATEAPTTSRSPAWRGLCMFSLQNTMCRGAWGPGPPRPQPGWEEAHSMLNDVTPPSDFSQLGRWRPRRLRTRLRVLGRMQSSDLFFSWTPHNKLYINAESDFHKFFMLFT